MRSRTFTLLSLIVAALAIRLLAIGAFGLERVEFGDAYDYLATATSLCESGSYPAQGNLPFFRAPGLPFFIAGATFCDPSKIGQLKIALAIVDSLTVALIAILAFLVWRSEGAALAAGIAAAVYPLFIASVTDVRTEPLFMFLMTLALVALDRSSNRRWCLLAGASLAAAALTRPVALIFLPLLLLRRGRTAVLIGFLVVLAPWTIRNYARFGELILVNDAAGYSLWRGTHPEMARIYTIRDREAFHRASIEFEQRFTMPMMERINAVARTPRQRSAAWRRAAFDNIRRYPRLEAAFTLCKALVYWRPWLNPQEYSRATVAVSAAGLIALYVLAAFGLRRAPRPLLSWVVAYFVIGWLAHLPHQVVTRFRYPLTDPVLIAAAAQVPFRRRTGAGDDRYGDTSARPTLSS